MTDLDREFCSRAAAARRAAGLSQSALARELGCNQSAISMFESGNPTKLSSSIVQALAARLGIALDGAGAARAEDVRDAAAPAVLVRAFCPDCSCISNIPYVCRDGIFYRPAAIFAARGSQMRCADCGEVLETACPACGAPVNEGACCAACGRQYVIPQPVQVRDAAAWAAARRAEIEAVRGLSRPSGR